MNDKMKSPILALVVFLLKKSHRVSNTRRRFSFFYGTYCVRRHGVWHGAAPRTKKKVSLSLFRRFRYILFVCPASTLYTSIILIICFKLVRYSSRHSSLFGVQSMECSRVPQLLFSRAQWHGLCWTRLVSLFFFFSYFFSFLLCVFTATLHFFPFQLLFIYQVTMINDFPQEYVVYTATSRAGFNWRSV